METVKDFPVSEVIVTPQQLLELHTTPVVLFSQPDDAFFYFPTMILVEYLFNATPYTVIDGAELFFSLGTLKIFDIIPGNQLLTKTEQYIAMRRLIQDFDPSPFPLLYNSSFIMKLSRNIGRLEGGDSGLRVTIWAAGLKKSKENLEQDLKQGSRKIANKL